MDADGYYEGFYSLLDDSRAIRFDFYPNDSKLLDGLDRHWPVERLKWFTHGFYSVERQGSDILIMGPQNGVGTELCLQLQSGAVG